MRGGRIRNLLVALSVVIGLVASSSIGVRDTLAETSSYQMHATNAVVVDVDSGQVLFERGMHDRVSPASLTKIFTSVVALEMAAIEREMTVDAYDIVGEASIGLNEGEQTTLETLLYGLMLTSGNDAAMTIARELANLPGDSPQESISRFVESVNSTANRLGIENTTLRNPHGLDQAGHLSTAADIAVMSMYALENPIFREIISTPYHAGDGREFYNVNLLMDVYPGLIGGKTGVTSAAGYCLMQVAERDGRTVMVVLLGSSQERWFADAEYLLDRGFSELAENPDDETRPVIGVTRAETIEVPEVRAGVTVQHPPPGSAARSSEDPEFSDQPAVGGNLSVDRLNDHEAHVRSSNPLPQDDSFAWRWPLISISMMMLALLAVINFPLILGMGAMAVDRGSRVRISMPTLPNPPSVGSMLSVAAKPFQRRPARRRYREQSGSHSQGVRTSAQDRWDPGRGSHTVTRERRHELRGTYTPAANGQRRAPAPEHTSSTNRNERSIEYPVTPAYTRAERAIKLALQTRYHAAADEFQKALELQPDIDLTKCPGFWRMQPMGYMSAARAYIVNDQPSDARRLLTVVQLAFSSNEELVGLFGRAIKSLEE